MVHCVHCKIPYISDSQVTDEHTATNDRFPQSSHCRCHLAKTAPVLRKVRPHKYV